MNPAVAKSKNDRRRLILGAPFTTPRPPYVEAVAANDLSARVFALARAPAWQTAQGDGVGDFERERMFY